jgi:enamine deaminase RidA (YjgF/YER057c/UK114 family)
VRRFAATCSALLLSTALVAQAQTPGASSSSFEKKNYNYSEWTKGLFSEVVTVTHPGKMIFLAGVGAEDESGGRGTIRHLGDFAGQCRYAYDKIKRLLAAHGATMNDVVKVVTYVTDVRNLPEAGKPKRAVSNRPTHYSITSSARASRAGGTSRPSASTSRVAA